MPSRMTSITGPRSDRLPASRDFESREVGANGIELTRRHAALFEAATR